MDEYRTTEDVPRSNFSMLSWYPASKLVVTVGGCLFGLIVIGILWGNADKIFWFVGGATIGALAASADANRIRALPALAALLGGILTGHFTLSFAVILSWAYVSWRLNCVFRTKPRGISDQGEGHLGASRGPSRSKARGGPQV